MVLFIAFFVIAGVGCAAKEPPIAEEGEFVIEEPILGSA
jgi:hypothetical protein